MARDPTRPSPGSKSGVMVAVLLVLLTWAALGGIVRNGFVNYDDDLYLTENPALSSGSAAAALAWAFTTTLGGNWHPLTWISHLIDVRLFGMNPAAHHAVGLALHSVNALLLFALLRGLTGALWPSALVAALFAVHPLHVESVAWAAERKDLLSTLLALGATLMYVRAVRRPGGRASRAAVLLLFALALMAKPMPLTLPLLLLLLDWWPLGRWSPTPGTPTRATSPLHGFLPPLPLWREKAPLLLLATVSAVITLNVQADAGAMQAAAAIDLPARMVNAVVAYAGYLRKFLWPSDLAILYPYPWGGHPPLEFFAALALLTALVALALRQALRRPWLPVGLLWFLASLLPVIGLVQVGEQALADRYTYLPLVGIFVAAAWWLAEIAGSGRRQARTVVGASLAAIVILGAIAARQAGTWRDGETLFSRALAVTRDNYIAHNNLGTMLLRRGNAAAALPHFEETVRTAPHSPQGFQNLGRALEHLGRREEALAVYREALRLQPRNPGTLDLLGVALARSGRAGEAVRLLEEATVLAPGNTSIRAHLAVANAQLAATPGRTPAGSADSPSGQTPSRSFPPVP